MSFERQFRARGALYKPGAKMLFRQSMDGKGKNETPNSAHDNYAYSIAHGLLARADPNACSAYSVS